MKQKTCEEKLKELEALVSALEYIESTRYSPYGGCA